MSTVGDLLSIVTIAIMGITPSNSMVGEHRSGGEGVGHARNGAAAGGGGFMPGGLGAGYGEAPPKQPQDATSPPPERNVTSLNPCYEKCDAEDEARAIACTKLQDEAQRKACQERSFEKYKSCRDSCEHGANTDCDSKYQTCINNGPFSCSNSSGGKSQCQRCWERCNAGDSPSLTCRKCRF